MELTQEQIHKILELADKTTDIDEVKGVLSAVDIIDDSIKRYKEKFVK